MKRVTLKFGGSGDMYSDSTGESQCSKYMQGYDWRCETAYWTLYTRPVSHSPLACEARVAVVHRLTSIEDGSVSYVKRHYWTYRAREEGVDICYYCGCDTTGIRQSWDCGCCGCN